MTTTRSLRTRQALALLYCACCVLPLSCATPPTRVESVHEKWTRRAQEKYGYRRDAVVKVAQEDAGRAPTLTLYCPAGADKDVSRENRIALFNDLAQEAAQLNREAERRRGDKGMPPWLEGFEYEVGDVVLTSTNDPIGVLVRLFTFSKYNHAAIVTNLVEGDTPGQKMPVMVEAIPPVVRTVNPRELLRNPETAVMIRRKNADWFTADIQKSVARRSLEKDQKPYDVWFLLRIGFSRIPLIGRLFLSDKEAQRYVCTELVQMAYYEGVTENDADKAPDILFGPHPVVVARPLPEPSWWPLHFITPKDFEKTPKLETVLRKEKGRLPASAPYRPQEANVGAR